LNSKKAEVQEEGRCKSKTARFLRVLVQITRSANAAGYSSSRFWFASSTTGRLLLMCPFCS